MSSAPPGGRWKVSGRWWNSCWPDATSEPTASKHINKSIRFILDAPATIFPRKAFCKSSKPKMADTNFTDFHGVEIGEIRVSHFTDFHSVEIGEIRVSHFHR